MMQNFTQKEDVNVSNQKQIGKESIYAILHGMTSSVWAHGTLDKGKNLEAGTLLYACHFV